MGTAHSTRRSRSTAEAAGGVGKIGRRRACIPANLQTKALDQGEGSFGENGIQFFRVFLPDSCWSPAAVARRPLM